MLKQPNKKRRQKAANHGNDYTINNNKNQAAMDTP